VQLHHLEFKIRHKAEFQILALRVEMVMAIIAGAREMTVEEMVMAIMKDAKVTTTEINL
jgi:hypothetical protein